MQIRNAADSYGWVSVALNWIVAILVITLWVLGTRIGFQPDRDAKHAATALHASVGILAWTFLVARVAWHFAQKQPAALEQHWILMALSRIVQYGLLLVITVQAITGPLLIWMSGQALTPFGWFAIASPFARNREIHETLETIHSISANYVFLPLIGLHVLGGFKHLVIDRDGIFQRMVGVHK